MSLIMKACRFLLARVVSVPCRGIFSLFRATMKRMKKQDMMARWMVRNIWVVLLGTCWLVQE
jgi:hypothetical protein